MRSTIVKVAVNIVMGMGIGATLSVGFASHGIGTASTDQDKPVNAPNYATHADAARPLCFLHTEEWDVVKAGPNIVAGHVVVVKLDGSMVRMDTSEAFDRAGSKTRADDIWVVGVCRGDIVGRRVTMKFNPDARLDNSRVRNY